MRYEWRFPDWEKKDQPKSAELEVLIEAAAILCPSRIARGHLELRLEQIAGGLLNADPATIVITVVKVNRAHTIIEVRNNG